MTLRTFVAEMSVFRRVAALLVFLWAGFWAWFVLAVSIGEEPAAPFWIPTTWLLGLSIVAGAAIVRPRLGALLLLVVAGFTFFYFANDGARLLLSAPAFVLAAATFVAARGRKK
jgi:hypothetical protein